MDLQYKKNSVLLLNGDQARSAARAARTGVAVILMAVALSGCSVLLDDREQVERVWTKGADEEIDSLEEVLMRRGTVVRQDDRLPPPELDLNWEVKKQIDYYSGKNRRFILDSLTRLEKYYTAVSRVFDKAGVPLELLCVGIVESGFNPKATSRSGAAGIWQFMRNTARSYGLRVGFLRDERRNVVLSSRAAAAHLRDLYEEFGKWPLALAAYNAGKGRIIRLLEKTGAKDFWTLGEKIVLKKETALYVPKFMAVLFIMRNLSEFGFRMRNRSVRAFERRLRLQPR